MSDIFGTWREQKDAIDAADDGNGPYLHWSIDGRAQSLWPDFLMWAKEHLACGISFACVDGALIVPAAHAAFAAYVAGRDHNE